MIFNSIEFAFFLVVVFFIYWVPLKKDLNLQNLFLLISSYFFYGWWNWKFLTLIAFSSVADYLVGQHLGKSQNQSTRKGLLLISILINLGLLGFFKYYNFFAQNFVDAFLFFGSKVSLSSLQIVLPVGISFYTFQTMSYTIDVYRKKITPCKDYIAFFAFVSFFPQLVAGPIERAGHLLPQFLKARFFDYKIAVSGIRIILWGLFKKMVIADNAAIIVDGIFSDYSMQSPLSLSIGILFFAFQIYGDFSGYSDIAIGISRLFGFDLMNNFRFPYLSSNISEFWKRWHISLSSWFKDYLYIPLGGNRKGKWFSLINVLIVFLVSGFWHGANWTFIIWGLINGLLYVPLYISKGVKDEEYTQVRLTNLPKILFTFILVGFGWVYFRSPSVYDANQYLIHLFAGSGSAMYFSSSSKHLLISLICLIGITIILTVEIRYSKLKKTEVTLSNFQLVLLSLFILFMAAFKNPISFIYFQF
ncbi:MAG: MBOAT family protein [Algoriphagus sp.]|nr:MBOAT family protein [Algoriphagus sp.]